ncbi:MAG: hypothetical protein FJW64_16100 [Actinobacteria bacterium]|nr:hypothetical protein [Actinomycetota bacterium]
MWMVLSVLSAAMTMLVCLTIPAVVGATVSEIDTPDAVTPLSVALCLVGLAVHAAVIVRVARPRG